MDYKAKKDEITKKFESVKANLEKASMQVKQMNEELMMLQGEYRAIDKLEKDEVKEPKEQPKK